MDDDSSLRRAAQLFKVLGGESRLRILRELAEIQLSVSSLVDATGLSQPLVSQHLRTMRQVGLVVAERDGKEMKYQVADKHVIHVISDALIHVQEPAVAAATETETPGGHDDQL